MRTVKVQYVKSPNSGSAAPMFSFPLRINVSKRRQFSVCADTKNQNQNLLTACDIKFLQCVIRHFSPSVTDI